MSLIDCYYVIDRKTEKAAVVLLTSDCRQGNPIVVVDSGRLGSLKVIVSVTVR